MFTVRRRTSEGAKCVSQENTSLRSISEIETGSSKYHANMSLEIDVTFASAWRPSTTWDRRPWLSTEKVFTPFCLSCRSGKPLVHLVSSELEDMVMLNKASLVLSNPWLDQWKLFESV